MKKQIRTVISLLLLLGALMANFVVVQAVEPRYTSVRQIHATVELSTDGKASCYGDVKLSSGYTADVKVELKQDGTTIKTWTKSGSGTISISGTYYVMTGHSYMVTTTATV
jgi:hypothetical protein